MLEPVIEKAMVPQRVALIFGARRVGKTILLENILKQVKGNVLLLNGDDADTLRLLEERSIANYRRLLHGVDVLAIDEAQQIPDIGHKLKLIVDTIQNIRVIATGSSSFDLLNQSGEPLVGRARQFLLTPFSQKEISQEEIAQFIPNWPKQSNQEKRDSALIAWETAGYPIRLKSF